MRRAGRQVILEPQPRECLGDWDVVAAACAYEFEAPRRKGLSGYGKEVFVGIDVAKAHLAVAFNDEAGCTRYTNDDAGISKLVEHLKSLQNSCFGCHEARRTPPTRPRYFGFDTATEFS